MLTGAASRPKPKEKGAGGSCSLKWPPDGSSRFSPPETRLRYYYPGKVKENQKIFP
jgi:hypothetical protein